MGCSQTCSVESLWDLQQIFIPLYFAPVGMITGFMAGIATKQMHGLVFEETGEKLQIIIGALFITIPGTMVSSVINAVLFGGVTSSGSSILVQILSRTPLGLTGSIFAVQILPIT